MTDYFIEKIVINEVRHLKDIEIDLGKERKYLILTGKNGCGKTSVLERLDKFLSDFFKNNHNITYFDNRKNIDPTINKSLFNKMKQYEECYPIFDKKSFFDDVNNIDFIYAYFPVNRINETIKPQGINKIDLPSHKTSKLNRNFLQFLVNLKAEKSFANDDGDVESVKKIEKWFNDFENMLKKIFDDDSLKLQFDRKEYNFTIIRDNRVPFDFNTLSSGYSAIIDIISELLLKVEVTKNKSFETQGIVLIDEIETHLHVELQKNIFELLNLFFPNIQFIVTTHSPFILSSISNTVIYDLETKTQVENLSGYSYEALVDTYFNVDKYSNELKGKLNRFKELNSKRVDKSISEVELNEFNKLEIFFEQIPHYKNEELGYILNKIKLQDLGV